MTEPRRFTSDAGGERAFGRLRLLGAVVIVCASGWIVTSGPGVLLWGVLVLSWLVALAWIVSWRRSERRAHDAARWYLDLGADALVLAEGERVVTVAWDDVTGVDVDEERIVVVVARRSAGPLVLEPRYPGTSIEALAEAVRAHARPVAPTSA